MQNNQICTLNPVFIINFFLLICSINRNRSVLPTLWLVSMCVLDLIELYNFFLAVFAVEKHILLLPALCLGFICWTLFILSGCPCARMQCGWSNYTYLIFLLVFAPKKTFTLAGLVLECYVIPLFDFAITFSCSNCSLKPTPLAILVLCHYTSELNIPNISFSIVLWSTILYY